MSINLFARQFSSEFPASVGLFVLFKILFLFLGADSFSILTLVVVFCVFAVHLTLCCLLDLPHSPQYIATFFSGQKRWREDRHAHDRGPAVSASLLAHAGDAGYSGQG